MRTTTITAIAIALAGLAAPAWAGPPESEEENRGVTEVSDFDVRRGEDGTYLRLESSRTPSFSVFKLRSPLRLVVDVSNSRLSGEEALERVDDGIISRVSLMERQNEGQSGVRLIVGFERAAHYDVRTEGDDVVIFVEGDHEPNAGGGESRAELEENREKLGELRGKFEKAQSNLEQRRSELREVRNRLSEARQNAEKLRAEIDEEGDARERERLEEKLEQKNSELEKLQRKLTRKSESATSLQRGMAELKNQKNEAESRVAKLERALSDQKSKARERAEKLESLRAEREQWDEKLEERNSKYEDAVAELESMKGRLAEARSELEQLEREREDAEGAEREEYRAKLERKTTKLGELRSELENRKETVGSLRSEVQKLERERDRAREEVAAVEKRWRERLQANQSKFEEAKSELKEARSRLERAKGEIETLRQKKRRATGEARERLESKLAEKSSELEAKERKLEAKENRLEDREETVGELKARLEELEERESKKAERLAAQRKRLEERDEKIASLSSRVERLRSEVDRSEGDAEARRAKLEELESRLERQKREMAQLRQTKQRQQKKLAELRSTESNEAAESSEGATERPSEAEETSGRAARAVPLDDTESAESNAIRDIRLENRSGESRIVVELERPGEYKRLPWRESRAVMLLNNVELPDRLEQTIKAKGSSGAVRFVSSFTESEGRVRMEAEIDEEEAEEKIRQEGNKLVWEFAPDVADADPGEARAESGSPTPPDEGTSYTSAPPEYPRTIVDPSKVDRVPGMSRKQITLDLHNADIHNVLRWFSKEGGTNIIASDDISGSSTISLERVPLDQAFLIVLQSNGLGFEKRQDVIRVAPQEKLREEQKAREEARKRSQKTRPLEVFLMPMNYAEADEMTGQVERLLSPRGSVSVDERTNTLIIKDLPENIRSIRELVGALDAQVPQVLIEARIVETNDTFSQEFGIQWGGDFTASQGNGNPTGLVFPNVLGVAGGATDGQTPTQGSSSNPNFAVNLPAAAGTGSGGAIGLTMGNVNGSVNLNLRLSAAEESGRAKIISAPKILTLDNREATISQGTSIPISVVSAAGVQTVFVDATLELTVTPHVTPDGNVQLQIEATKNEPDFQNTGARGDPTIIRKQAETELLIEDGDTTVIGGIYTRNTGRSVTGVPILHQIPILGLLFKKTSRSERRSELLIFITPRVVNRAEALGGMSAGDVVETQGSTNSEGQSGEE